MPPIEKREGRVALVATLTLLVVDPKALLGGMASNKSPTFVLGFFATQPSLKQLLEPFPRIQTHP